MKFTFIVSIFLFFALSFLLGCLKIKEYQDINQLGIMNSTVKIQGMGNLMKMGKMSAQMINKTNESTEITEKEICDRIMNSSKNSSMFTEVAKKVVVTECKYDKEGDILTLKTNGISLMGNTTIYIKDGVFTYRYKPRENKKTNTTNKISLNLSNEKTAQMLKMLGFEYDLYVTFPGKVNETNGEIDENDSRKVHFNMFKVKEAKATGKIEACFLPIGLISMIGIISLSQKV